jgi:hypothetical protein
MAIRVVIKAEPGVLTIQAKDRWMTLEERLARFDPERHDHEAMG